MRKPRLNGAFSRSDGHFPFLLDLKERPQRKNRGFIRLLSICPSIPGEIPVLIFGNFISDSGDFYHTIHRPLNGR